MLAMAPLLPAGLLGGSEDIVGGVSGSEEGAWTSSTVSGNLRGRSLVLVTCELPLQPKSRGPCVQVPTGRRHRAHASVEMFLVEQLFLSQNTFGYLLSCPSTK